MNYEHEMNYYNEYDEYYESSKGVTITRSRAIKELKNHCVDDYDSFFNDMGYHENYIASDVLDWLGYWYEQHVYRKTRK